MNAIGVIRENKFASLDDYWQTGLKVTITTKGGFKTLPYPIIKAPQ